MNTTEVGRKSESEAINYLISLGFEIMGRNWKTPRCEIDIVAYKAGTVYFIEVKFRSNDAQGDGLNYISSAKLKQMAFAANVWVARNEWPGVYILGCISATGNKCRSTELILLD